ncbi:hypothetical protein B0T12DRAFT_32998 [Alternaria alternata]|nr:hypothetical protein B0T12DRAFT_32998 [Alternaria alternata]
MKFIFLIPVVLGLAVAGPMSPSDHDGNVLERQLPDPGKACTSEQKKICVANGCGCWIHGNLICINVSSISCAFVRGSVTDRWMILTYLAVLGGIILALRQLVALLTGFSSALFHPT